MTEINDAFKELKEFQKEKDFKEKHRQEVEETVWDFCKNYDKPVKNLKQFIADMEDEMLGEMWLARLDRSERARKSRMKKKEMGVANQHLSQPKQQPRQQHNNNNNQRH